jgi:hypothetical protein
MSHERQQSRKHRLVRALVRGFLAAAIAATCIYMAYRVYASRTNSWPETRECTVIGSRVVNSVLDFPRRPLVLWHGEYHVQYSVNRKEYFLWATAGVMDSEKTFVKEKISDLPADCPYRVQYNPRDPAESVAYRERP